MSEDKVMRKLTPLHGDFLAYCVDDWTGLWLLVKRIKPLHSSTDADKIQAHALEIIRDLIEAGYIMAGDVDFGLGKFRQWNLSVDKIIGRIEQEWIELGRDPTICEIVWFVSTTEGDYAFASGQFPETPSTE
ncbi:MAG TPA: hypothetical protein PKL51_08630 [Nitrospira sp.]|nr:hypothetical protein [Nitrospira sp.]